MFRTLARLLLPNPLDRMLKRGGKKILLGWNRGLGDIALGLYAIVHRIRELIPDAEITFITRENLRDGFSMLEGVKTLVAPDWKRGQSAPIDPLLKKQYDLVIEKPSPTDWVQWQRGTLTPRLKWDPSHDLLHQKFPSLNGVTCIGVQVVTETHYGLWRNWPLERWHELFDRLEKMPHVKVLLFGFGNEPKFPHKNLIDLRGKTTLFELLSIIKHRCYALVLPDSGISSMTYYLDASFPIRLVTLWADPNQGILKQKVASPNPQLVHCPLIGEERNLATVTVSAVMAELFPAVGIILAGGQGTRLGFTGPKGLFPIAGKSLFQWLCEKVSDRRRPLAIMTSELNHEETVAYFEKHQFFGLEVHFFQQEMEPLLDEEKRPLPVQGPNGNGSVFRSFVKSGLADLFARRGIDLVTVTNVDNPLSDPFDAGLIAKARGSEVAVQCIERTPLYPSMGALVERSGRMEIVEYTDLDPAADYKLAYSGQMAFDLSFFRKMAEVPLPTHWVKKKLDDRWIWKGEQYLFDALPHASRVEAIVSPCETCYAPVKSRESIALVEKLLREKR
ncbi:MAG TPA: UTP--glucose-1-phosphate uridylyltransferase [Chlamydiales bacterium]|nr:UTP--glucose-1-phosphate uridylyltransferase [Chlamydiales bacterium]